MRPASTPLDLGCPVSRPARSLTPRFLADRAMAGLARILIRTFFRNVDVEHAERLASGRPTVVVANHGNGLVDGLVLLATLGRHPRFLGKSTLFRNPLLWPFLKLAGVVPVYRSEDHATMARNAETFARSNRLLANGGMVAIFPEGISHDHPSLQPLRTGAARIALGASASGVTDVETVAVAVAYDENQRFRSRALVTVGVPVGVTDWMAQYRADDHAAVRSLTDDLAVRLRAVEPEHGAWREDTCATFPPLGLTDSQVAVDDESHRLRPALWWWRRRAMWSAMAKGALALPFALAGAAIHIIPYELVKLASRVPANRSMRATVKLLGNFFLFIALYVTLGVLIGEQFGVLAGILAGVGPPVCGAVTVRTAERAHLIGRGVGGRHPVRRGQPMASVPDPMASVPDRRRADIDAAQAITDPRFAAGP